MTLVFEAVDHGMSSVADGGPLVPMAMTEDPQGSRTLHRFAVEQLEDGPASIRKFAASAPTSVLRIVGAWDGYVTMGGVRTDALMIEAAERGVDRTFLFIQRYKPKAFLRKASAVGNVGYTGEREGSLFDPEISR